MSELDRIGRAVDVPQGKMLQLPDEDPCVDGGVIVFARVFEADPYQRPYVYAAVRVNGLYFLTQRGVGGDTAVPARRWEKLVKWLGDSCLGMVRMRPDEVLMNVLLSVDPEDDVTRTVYEEATWD